MKKIDIYGAGLSGLTAAINLVKDGYNLTVYEKEKKLVVQLLTHQVYT